MALSPPAPLAETNELEAFSCGVVSLDAWLKRRARGNQVSGASRTFVAAEGRRVVAYYALASGGIALASAPGKFRRNMPDPIPIEVLARLAVDAGWQGGGLGRALFRDCAARILQAADIIGIRGIVVHAISEPAKAFYIGLGMEPSPLDPMTLLVTLPNLRAAFESQ